MTRGQGARLRRGLVGAALAAALVSMTGCALFGDDAAAPPPYPAAQQPDTARVRWKNTRGGKALAGFQPAITSRGLWVVDEKGRVRLLSRDEGKELAAFRIDGKAAAGLDADEDLIVVVNRDGTVIGLDTEGKQRWTTPLHGEVTTAPVITEAVVLVRTVEGRVVALERGGGTVRWSWQAPNALLTLRQSSPMLVDGDTVYLGLPQARLVALDVRLGAPRWETTIASSLGATELERLIDVVGAPVLMEDKLCAVAYQGRVACVSAYDGETGWSRALSSSSGVAATSDALVLVDAGEVVQLIRPGGGTAWRQEGYVRRRLTAPVVADQDRVLFGDSYGRLTVLSLADGRTLAGIDLDDSAFATPPRVDDGMAYVQTLDGTVAAVTLR
ncbi:MAG: PQQ-binding-like beta-propeller repeat protein [Lautropia sp.]|nr:PQQ-binding-like beta-propeller repeat protein [Lautropia sp.]